MNDLSLGKSRQFISIAAMLLATLVQDTAAGVSSAYNSFSYRQLIRKAYDYLPSGSSSRQYTGSRIIREREYYRLQNGFDSSPTGTTKHFQAGWTAPIWTQNPGPIVRANNSTRIRWGAPNNYLLEFSKSDSQSSSYSCDAVYDGDAFYYNPPGAAPWVREINPAFNWEREIYILVSWRGVYGGLAFPNPIDVVGIPSLLLGSSGLEESSRRGFYAGYRWNGYLSIGPPEGATADSHITGVIELH